MTALYTLAGIGALTLGIFFVFAFAIALTAIQETRQQRRPHVDRQAEAETKELERMWGLRANSIRTTPSPDRCTTCGTRSSR